MSRVRLYVITDPLGSSRDYVAALSADSAVEYLATGFHGYDNVRDCIVDGLIDSDGARELTEEELDELDRAVDEKAEEFQTFREALASDLDEGCEVPFHFAGTE